MSNNVNLEKKSNTKSEVLNKIGDVVPVSKKKVFRMRNKMKDAFKELKDNQDKLKAEHKSLVFAQNELKIWQDNYVKLFNLADVGYFTVYKDLIVKEVNGAGCKMLGYGKFDVIGQPLVVHAEPTLRDNLRQHFNQVFEQGSGSISAKFITGKEKAVPVSIQSVLIAEDSSAMPCCLCAVVDVSTIENMKDDIESYREKLDELAQRHADELAMAVESQQQKADLFTQEKQELENTIEQQNEKMAAFENATLELQEKLEDVCVEKDNVLSQSQEFESLVKEQTFELAKLQGHVEKAKQQGELFAQLQDQHHEHKQQASEKNNQLQAKIQVLDQQNKELEHRSGLEKQKLAAMIKERSRKISELVERLGKLKDQSNTKIVDLTKRLDDSERILGGKVNELTLINQKMQDQLSSAREEAQQHRSRANRVDKLYKQNQMELAAAKKEIDVRGYTIAEIEKRSASELEKVVSRLRDTSDELDMLKQVYKQREDDIAALNDQIEAGRVKIEDKESDKARLSRALEQSRTVVKRLCDVGAISMNVYNIVERKMAYVNRHIGQVLGYTQEQIDEFGDDIISKVMHPDDVARISNDLNGFSWDSSDEIVELEYRLIDAEGNWRYIHSQECVLETDSSGKPTEVLGIQYDYTEKMQAKEGMKALAKIVAMVGKNPVQA